QDAERYADGETESHRGDADGDGALAAIQDARVDVPAELVGAEIMLAADRGEPITVVGLDRVVRGENGRQQSHDEQEDDHDAAERRGAALRQLLQPFP